MKKEYLTDPTRPVEVHAGMSCSDLLRGLEGCSFQGRQLALAAKIWTEALDDDVLIWLGFAGAMVPAGMRKVVTTLMEHRCIDAIVSTGANLYHDLYETTGLCHYIGTHRIDDKRLRRARVDRIYDTFADENAFIDLDRHIGEWAGRTLEERPYGTPEFFKLLGEEALKISKGEQGILTTAARLNVPIFCPAVGDSSIGIALARVQRSVLFDVVGDVKLSADLVAGKETMVIYVGGGTPKNFIQQTEVTNMLLEREVHGHKYAVQFVVDAPHWGGLSGCTFEEAVSWGKIALDAKSVTVQCDATIALPVVASAVLTRRKGTKRPGRGA